MKFKVGVESVSSYKRLSYTPWHALAEFIDNSTQAYFDNRKKLDAAFKREKTKLTVNVVYDRARSTLTIKDNSIGMTEAEVEQALHVAGSPPRPSGRSRFGMGLKTAACWFGDTWVIKTKKLGEALEVTVSVDVEKVATGHVDIKPKIVDTRDSRAHYTELTIKGLHKKLAARTLGKIRDFLRSMYRYDIVNGDLDLYCQNGLLEWTDFEDRILKTKDGVPYKKTLDFKVHNHRITGYVAVLGSGSRELAGFTLLQNRRVIRGYPDSWRPTTLYGQLLGTNDLVNQRLVGELHVDGFQVSHTKDDIIWDGEEEEAVEDKLLEECADYRTIAARTYKGTKDERAPGEAVVDAAVDQVTRDLNSNELADKIELTDAPPEEVVDQTFKAVVDQEKDNEPRIDVRVGTRRVKLHLSSNESITDPYVAIDIEPDETTIVVVNMNHPYLKFLTEQGSMTDYLRHCMFDALAMNKARVQKGRVHYNTVQAFKDQLLRVPHEIHDLEPEGDSSRADEEDSKAARPATSRSKSGKR